MARLAWILGLCAAIGCGRSNPAVQQRAVRGDLAIVGATVVPMDREGTLVGHTILVRGDRITFTRAADADQRRSYTITGKHGDLDLTGRLTVDADGAPHEAAVTVKYGTFITRRLD